MNNQRGPILSQVLNADSLPWRPYALVSDVYLVCRVYYVCNNVCKCNDLPVTSLRGPWSVVSVWVVLGALGFEFSTVGGPGCAWAT